MSTVASSLTAVTSRTSSTSSTSNRQQHVIEIGGRAVVVTLSKAASKALAQRTTPLLAEMELYFSCLIRKQVRFRNAETPDASHNIDGNSDDITAAVPFSEQLHIRFRPVMTRACGKDYEGDEPPLTDFPIANARPYVPHWLNVDFRGGQWQGEFGYDSAR